MRVRDIQKDLVIDYIKRHGELTVFDAVGKLKILSPTKRISELRRDGWSISTTYRESLYGTRYGVWKLEEDNDARS